MSHALTSDLRWPDPLSTSRFLAVAGGNCHKAGLKDNGAFNRIPIRLPRGCVYASLVFGILIFACAFNPYINLHLYSFLDRVLIPRPIFKRYCFPLIMALSENVQSEAGEDANGLWYGKLVDTYGNEFQVPNVTIKDIRSAIPAHCFARSALRGFAYIARDVLLLVTTFCLYHQYVTPEHIKSDSLRWCLGALYGFLQGLFATGLWVIAHECGHQSFSTSKVLNDTTGWVLHSALLVPYFSWKISHGKHHKSTGHMERDMVFLPKTREVYASKIRRGIHELSELTEEAPLITALVLFGRQIIGWPLYLMQNNTGHDYHERQSEGRGAGKRNGPLGGVNHFSPASPIFEAKDIKYIVLSDLGLGITATILYQIAKSYGWSSLLV